LGWGWMYNGGQQEPVHTSDCISVWQSLFVHRVGQNRTYTLYTNVYLMISLPKVTYIHRIRVVGYPNYSGRPGTACKIFQVSRNYFWYYSDCKKNI